MFSLIIIKMMNVRIECIHVYNDAGHPINTIDGSRIFGTLTALIPLSIETYVSNSHIGFDPDYEVIKKRDPLLTGLLSIGSLSSLNCHHRTSSRKRAVSCQKTAW